LEANFLKNSIGDDPSRAIGDPLWRQAIDWLAAGLSPQSSEIRSQLLQHSLMKNTTLVVLVLAMSLVACVAIFITGQAWAYAWLIAELFIGYAKLSFQVAFESETSAGKTGDGTGPIVAGLAGGIVLGIAGYQCVASQDWLLILLSGICLGGLVGGISSRSAGTPRMAVILMCLVTLPYALATLLSPMPNLYLIGLQMPLFLGGLVLVVRQDYSTLVSLYRAQRENRWLANHDLLTGLPNRTMELKCFDDLLRVDGVPATDGLSLFTVFCLDLDGFKNVNDRLGHAAGDALLVAVAGRLRGCIRDIDFLFRVGGDEFVILLPSILPGEATVIAHRIIQRIAEPFDMGPQSAIRIGISVGSASALTDGGTADELLRSADLAMYEAKRRGKGRYLTLGAAQQSVDLLPYADADARKTPRPPESRAFPAFPLPNG
jgi:diguanylate cyclase